MEQTIKKADRLVIKDATPHEIRMAMLRARAIQMDIARACGVTHAAVYRVIEGLSVSHVIREAISAATGISLEELWPETYVVHGGPRKPGHPPAKQLRIKPNS